MYAPFDANHLLHTANWINEIESTSWRNQTTATGWEWEREGAEHSNDDKKCRSRNGLKRNRAKEHRVKWIRNALPHPLASTSSWQCKESHQCRDGWRCHAKANQNLTLFNIYIGFVALNVSLICFYWQSNFYHTESTRDNNIVVSRNFFATLLCSSKLCDHLKMIKAPGKSLELSVAWELSAVCVRERCIANWK